MTLIYELVDCNKNYFIMNGRHYNFIEIQAYAIEKINKKALSFNCYIKEMYVYKLYRLQHDTTNMFYYIAYINT